MRNGDSDYRRDEEDMLEDDHAVQQEASGFSVKETIDRQTVSHSNNDICEMNVNINKNHLLHQVWLLQCRVNNLNLKKRKMSFASFKVKQRNIYGFVLIVTGNLVHSAFGSWDFWEAIGGKLNRHMDHSVGTA